jgi:hypothetical protein
MRKIKKLLLVTTSIVSFIASASAEDVKAEQFNVQSSLKVKLSGFAHFQAGFRNQSGLTTDEKNVSANRKDFAFYNDAAMVVEASNDINDVDYGAKIVLVPTAKRKGSPTYNGSHIFMESDFGRFEGGSPINASTNMMIDAGLIASATGGDWDRYAKYDSAAMTYNGLTPSFETYSMYFLDDKLATELPNRKYSSEPARSVSYYTPNFELTSTTKVQLGVTYIADSGNTGADAPDKQSSGTSTKNTSVVAEGKTDADNRFEIDKTTKDSFAAGIALEQSISDGVDFKIALTGEYGKSAGKTKQYENNTLIATHKLSNLKAYNIGAILNVGSFSYAASYGSLGKSLTTPAFNKTGLKTDYYTGAVAYKQGPFSTSVSYFKSNAFKNTIDVVTVGTDYKMAPGIKPYVEVSGFTLKGRPEYFPEAPKKKSRGTVALIGAKFSL